MEIRQAIRHALQAYPGMHFRGLGRRIGVTSSGQLRHHLDVLAKENVVVEVREGKFVRYYLAGQEPKDLQVHAMLSRPVPNHIVRALQTGPMKRSTLRTIIGKSDTTMAYHLDRLLRADVVRRAMGEYSLRPDVEIPDITWRTP